MANTKHLDDLETGRVLGEFRQGTNFLKVDQVELHIYVPKANINATITSNWIAAINSKYPNLIIEISDVEKHVGL